MLTFTASEERANTCFKFIGAEVKSTSVHLISDNTSLISPSAADGGMDTCSFYSGPSDATIAAFGESYETTGSIAYLGGETSGSIAYSGAGESCGTIASASASSFSSGASMGGGCSYSC